MVTRPYLLTFCMLGIASACVSTSPPVAIVGDLRDAGGTAVDAHPAAKDAQNSRDAAVEASSTCVIRDSVQSCGTTCQICPTTNGGIATCDGTRCGVTCLARAPLCSDQTCSRLRFDFSSSTAGSLIALTPVGLPLMVRAKDGNPALAFDVTDLYNNPISFRVPICLSGTVDLSRKQLSFRAFFDGGTPPVPSAEKQFSLSVSLANFQNNSNLPRQPAINGSWVAYKAPLNRNAFSGAASVITFQLGSDGETFAGTVWVDDIELTDM